MNLLAKFKMWKHVVGMRIHLWSNLTSYDKGFSYESLKLLVNQILTHKVNDVDYGDDSIRLRIEAFEYKEKDMYQLRIICLQNEQSQKIDIMIRNDSNLWGTKNEYPLSLSVDRSVFISDVKRTICSYSYSFKNRIHPKTMETGMSQIGPKASELRSVMMLLANVFKYIIRYYINWSAPK